MNLIRAATLWPEHENSEYAAMSRVWSGRIGSAFTVAGGRAGPGALAVRAMEWLALEHDPRDRQWPNGASSTGLEPVPETVDEALPRRDEIERREDIEIAVRRDGRYWRVVVQRVRQGAPG
jgi:hypothetical protein